MIIQVLTIIFQTLTVCVLGLTIYWQRKAAKERRRAEEIRASYNMTATTDPTPHTLRPPH